MAGLLMDGRSYVGSTATDLRDQLPPKQIAPVAVADERALAVRSVGKCVPAAEWSTVLDMLGLTVHA